MHKKRIPKSVILLQPCDPFSAQSRALREAIAWLGILEGSLELGLRFSQLFAPGLLHVRILICGSLRCSMILGACLLHSSPLSAAALSAWWAVRIFANRCCFASVLTVGAAVACACACGVPETGSCAGAVPEALPEL